MKIICTALFVMLLPGCTLDFSGSTERVVDIGQCHIVTHQRSDVRAHVSATKCGAGVAGALCRVLRSTK